LLGVLGHERSLPLMRAAFLPDFVCFTQERLDVRRAPDLLRREEIADTEAISAR